MGTPFLATRPRTSQPMSLAPIPVRRIRHTDRFVVRFDVAQVSFIAPIIVDTALGAIDRHIGEFKVLVHCNQGLSRSPSIALLYLLKHTDALGSQDPAAALLAFRRLSPSYAPAQGMADYVRLNWAKYLQDG